MEILALAYQFRSSYAVSVKAVVLTTSRKFALRKQLVKSRETGRQDKAFRVSLPIPKLN